MMKKLWYFFLALLVVCFVAKPGFAMPLPGGDLDRQQAIDTFFKDKPDDLLEGVWITDDNKYEIAIVKNDFSVCEGYDYLGFIVQSTDSAWEKGKIKLQLKATAVPKVFTGLVHKKANGYLTVTDGQALGTTFRLATNQIMEYFGERKERKLLFKIYPGNDAAVQAPNRIGTGFFITHDLVVTSNHVVDNAKTIEIKNTNGLKAAATVVAKDPANDLALLQVSKLEAPVKPLPMASYGSPKDGDSVYTVGFPLPNLLGAKPKLSEGIINSITGIQDDARVLQISIPIQPGNSGGPLINTKGQVVGIVTASVNPYKALLLTGTFPQNVNFAMKINYVDNLVYTLADPVRLPRKRGSADLTPAQIMALAKEAVVQVEVQ